MTRLSRIHPYPAMIADKCANKIAAQHIADGALVLDPFCGTGRTLYAAAGAGGKCFGIDINPLAVLIARAKSVNWLPALPAPQFLKKRHSGAKFNLQPGRKVSWFPKAAEQELGIIISWINSLIIDRSTRMALACILSATVREVSFCRKKQWKLHRMSEEDRQNYKPSPLKVFGRRLGTIQKALQEGNTQRKVTVVTGDSTSLRAIVSAWGLPQFYDVIFTSPPYGDSRSTVGYGGMSSMCLGVLQHVRDLELPFKSAQIIDSSCLGGSETQLFICNAIKKYWKGSATTFEWARVSAFLADLALSCQQIAAVSRIGTKAIFIVSRRCVRKRRLYIDRFLQDELRRYGFDLKNRSRRCIERKNTPYLIDRKARSKKTDKVKTMDHEFILVFEKRRDAI